MKKLIILICLLATAIVGYQIASALTISSGSISISSGNLSVFYPTSGDFILWDGSNDVILWDASGDSILWD